MTTIRQAIIDAAENLAGHTVTAGPTISDALDALTDVLAGEDVQGAQTIADAFAILGDHLDDNAPSGKITITENGTDIDVAQYATADVSVSGGGGEDIDFYVSGADAIAGTFTVGGTPVTLTTFESGDFSGKKGTVPAGSLITFAPAGGTMPESLGLYYWPDEQELFDDGDPITNWSLMYTSDDACVFVVSGVTLFNS